MWRKLVLPLAYLLLASLSVTTLRSVVPSLVSKQALFFVSGGLIFWLSSLIPFSLWKKYSWWFYLGLCALLAVTLVIGQATKGSTRWIEIPGLFNIQGSQLAFPILALLICRLFGEKPITTLKTYVLTLLVIAIPAGLIFVEPDLGTTIVLLAATGVMVFLVTARWSLISSSVLAGVILLSFSWFFLLPHQKQRLTSFVSPGQDQSGASYNARQSLIAVGSGQFLGRGLGQGVQSHLRFLPERQTDFIFASLAEELGFLGSGLVLFVYCLVLWHLLSHAWESHDRSFQLYLYGLSLMMLVQVTVNIGMNMGLLPITGLTLPFVSYGGSSTMAFALSWGIAQNGIMNRQPQSQLYLT